MMRVTAEQAASQTQCLQLEMHRVSEEASSSHQLLETEADLARLHLGNAEDIDRQARANMERLEHHFAMEMERERSQMAVQFNEAVGHVRREQEREAEDAINAVIHAAQAEMNQRNIAVPIPQHTPAPVVLPPSTNYVTPSPFRQETATWLRRPDTS